MKDRQERPGEGEALPPIGRYRIYQELGRGPGSVTYLAEDTCLVKRVVLKRFHVCPGEGPEVLQRHMRALREVVRLDHPNICLIWDLGEQDGCPYLTLPYIEGQTLAEVLRAGEPLPQRRAVEIVYKLARAVQEAHRHGIVHYDLKPAKVMIARFRGEPFLMDFGLSRRIELNPHGLLSLKGTPGYLSPEQIDGAAEMLGPASDQYSLGVILYELLTGKAPFRGTVAQVLVKTLTEAPEPPSWLQPDLDPALEEVCLRALAKQIPDRFASVGEFADALTRFLEDGG
jgi:serine/threonine-protein kinase